MVALLIGISPASTFLPFNSSELKDITDSWTTEEGIPVNLRKIGSQAFEDGRNVVLLYKLPSDLGSDTDLCFRSKNIFFTVSLDGKEIYSFYPKLSIIGSRSYGSALHHISIPASSSGGTITISAQPIYHDNNCFFDMMKLGSAGAYYQWFIRAHFLSFLLCLIIVIFGIIALIFSFTLGRNELGGYNLRSLAFFSIAVGCWAGLEETLIPQLLYGCLPFIHGLNYLLLIFMGYPAVQYANSLMARPKKAVGWVALIFTASEFVICILLNGLEILDFHELLPFIHTGLFLAAAAIVALFIENEIYCRKNNISNSNLVVVMAFIVFACFGIIDLLRYRFSDTGVDNSGYYMRMGLLLFFVILFVRSFFTLYRRMKLVSDAEAIRKVAYTDALTGLGSRAAFILREKELENAIQNGSLPAVLVCQFDTNDLKLVNDSFGHAFGDEFIRAASEAIRNSFGKEGDCYRIGGDEFTVFLTNGNLPEIFLRCRSKMAVLADNFNHSPAMKKPLYIACGSSLYKKSEGHTLEDAEHEADADMYKDKKRLKGEQEV